MQHSPLVWARIFHEISANPIFDKKIPTNPTKLKKKLYMCKTLVFFVRSLVPLFWTFSFAIFGFQNMAVNSLIHKAAGSLVTGRSLQNRKMSMGNRRTERPPDPMAGRPAAL